MFVVFEGIDGSGKTTVSNRVAKRLRKRGIGVEHVREEGEFSSPMVARIRELGKDPRNLAMDPLTELLLYAARDAQLLRECVNPALARGELVFADRYLYSCEVLSRWGRGLPAETVRPVVEGVAGGAWPDLVVLLDVDPHIARARRRARKIRRRGAGDRASGGSRKGLGGVGIHHRMREGYLALAAADPERWLVIDNTGPRPSLDAVIGRVTEAIEALWSGAPAAEVLARARDELGAVPGPEPGANGTLGAGRRAFYQVIEERSVREPALAAYLLTGLDDDPAHDLRERLAEPAPFAVAYSLRGLDGERAWSLREKLAEVSPYWVARSLAGALVDRRRVAALRRRFVDAEPIAVLATLDGDDSEAAWELRDRLAADFPRQVLSSMKHIDTERSWQRRDQFLAAAAGGDEVTDPEAAAALVSSLRGLSGARAWDLRERCLAAAPPETLRSLAHLDDKPSWDWRRRFAARAPKIVLRTIDGIDTPAAWQLRRDHAGRVKEALDSMVGLGGETAWALREACADVWPSTTVKSLGRLGGAGRGAELALRLFARYPRNVSLLKHVTRIEIDRERGEG